MVYEHHSLYQIPYSLDEEKKIHRKEKQQWCDPSLGGAPQGRGAPQDHQICKWVPKFFFGRTTRSARTTTVSEFPGLYGKRYKVIIRVYKGGISAKKILNYEIIYISISRASPIFISSSSYAGTVSSSAAS